MQFNSAQLKLIIDSIVWAFRHTERNVAETGLSLLQVSLCPGATQFFQAYYLHIMQETFAVMTDSFHKPGFKLQAHILHLLFNVLTVGSIQGPLWDVASKGMTAYPSNTAFVQEHVTGLLSQSFPNLTPQQDNAELFAEEVEKELAAQREAEQLRLAAVPGLRPQAAMPVFDDMADA
ncbi:importin N-terminal domain-containing protein [Haematococcus lacustris]|uniref:Importin N-terminal domain-containing protein n=1 Tax=Haematococcus lacustris TaxID=44745 RepID=A0A699YLQ2_HAELA|nr:importin N-terminal domain-containing protein [Haematococcus lacustris]